MTPERWQQIKAIFDGAVERGPRSLVAYLDERCGGDEELRREVESLLGADTQTGSLLEHPLLETLAGEGASCPPQNDSFGPYVPVRVLGEGGMGTVYLARQLQPIRRDVALKVVKLGMDSRRVLERFEIERQALALMDYPNVARVLDAGTSGSGRPYFVMEYVDGVPITQYCDGKLLSTRERLRLFIPVCNALQHAHKKDSPRRQAVEYPGDRGGREAGAQGHRFRYRAGDRTAVDRVERVHAGRTDYRHAGVYESGAGEP